MVLSENNDFEGELNIRPSPGRSIAAPKPGAAEHSKRCYHIDLAFCRKKRLDKILKVCDVFPGSALCKHEAIIEFNSHE
jgi:hypothetical protein